MNQNYTQTINYNNKTINYNKETRNRRGRFFLFIFLFQSLLIFNLKEFL